MKTPFGKWVRERLLRAEGILRRNLLLRRQSGYVLVRPLGGWNDILSQIRYALRYTRRTGRVLIIDTGSLGKLGGDFAAFFRVALPDVIYSEPEVRNLLSSLNTSSVSVFPETLQGRLYDYPVVFSYKYDQFVSGETPMSLNFNLNYPHTLLIHHGMGGGKALWLCQFLQLSPKIRNQFLENKTKLPQPYIGVHVRNTDHLATDIDAFYAKLVKEAKGQHLFISTDNLDSRNRLMALREHFKSISAFTELPADGKPLHSNRPEEARFQFSCDALCDLALLASATRLYVNNPRSGFSRLAMDLHRNQPILKHFIGTQTQLESINHTPEDSNSAEA